MQQLLRQRLTEKDENERNKLENRIKNAENRILQQEADEKRNIEQSELSELEKAKLLKELEENNKKVSTKIHGKNLLKNAW